MTTQFVYAIVESMDYAGWELPEVCFLRYEDALNELRAIGRRLRLVVREGDYIQLPSGAIEIHKMSVSNGPAPVWERGYRCHGYWIGLDRVGFIGLPPRCFARTTKCVYTWEFSLPGERSQHGRESTLRAAKRAVEMAFKRRIAEVQP